MATIADRPEILAPKASEPQTEVASHPTNDWGQPSKYELRQIAAERAWEKRVRRVLDNPNPPSIRDLRDICHPKARPAKRYLRFYPGSAVWRVTGMSAAPVIRPGDIIQLNPYHEGEHLQPGNVVLLVEKDAESSYRRGIPWLGMLVPGLPDEPFVAGGLHGAPASLKDFRILAFVTFHQIRYIDGLTTSHATTNGSALPVLSKRTVPSPPHGRPEICPDREDQVYRKSLALLMVDFGALDVREVVKSLRSMERCGELDSGEATALIVHALELHDEKYGSFAPEWKTAWAQARSLARGRGEGEWDPDRLREIRYSDDTDRSLKSRHREIAAMEAKLAAAADGYRTRILRDCGEDALAALSEGGQWRPLREMAHGLRQGMLGSGQFHFLHYGAQVGDRSAGDLQVATK